MDKNNFEQFESCVIDGKINTKYFKLNRGPRQGDLISAFLFILALEIIFLLIKENPCINGWVNHF